MKARAYKKSGSKKIYGKWSTVKSIRVSNGVGATAVSKIAQPSVGAIDITAKSVKGVSGYQAKISASKNFDSYDTQTKQSSKTIIKAKNLYSEMTYYVKVRAYKKSGSTKLYGAWSAVKKVKTKTAADFLVAKVKKYSYKVTPVNGKLNNIVFVTTNNPDPMSFQLVDTSSKYLEKGKTAAFKPLNYRYCDVVYSNRSTGRIANKGYLFYCYECNTDGGTLKVMANDGQYEYTNGPVTSYSDGSNYETGKTVTCQALEDRVDFLLRTYTKSGQSFFEKLDAVSGGLNDIALYPKGVLDTNKPNANGFPCLAASPYFELSLNQHIEGMYQSGDPLFLSAAYGFCLHSLSFPGMFGAVAERIDKNCKVEGGYYHYLVDITYKVETRTYGGAGEGSTHDFYTKFISKTFRFDGTDIGYGTNPSMAVMKAKRLEYAEKSDKFAQTALDKLSRKSVAKAVGDGGWIQIAYEGFLGGGTTIGYAAAAPDGLIEYASDAWVDGRYVTEYEAYSQGDKFADHPEADIIKRNVTYTDCEGVSHTGTVIYRYERDRDGWYAPYYYRRAYWCYGNDYDNIPASLILTRSQVDAMVKSGEIDGKSAAVPDPKWIYDGSAEPGTPVSKAKGLSMFSTNDGSELATASVSGVSGLQSMPESLECEDPAVKGVDNN